MMTSPYYGPLSLMPDDLVWSMYDFSKCVKTSELVALNQPVLAVPMPVGKGQTVWVAFLDERFDEPDFSDRDPHRNN